MSIELEKIMQLECLKESKIVAGKWNVGSKIVNGITIMEAPDIADWIKGGELLLTSLYSIHSDLDKQKELIVKLGKAGASGVIIKISRFIQEVPKELIAVGERYGIPIIQIPKDIKYVDIMYPIMRELFNKQLKCLEYYRNCHDRFVDLALNNGNLTNIAEELKSIIGCPILIYNTDFKTLAYTDEKFKKISYINENKQHTDMNTKLSLYKQEAQFEGETKENISLVSASLKVLDELKAFLAVIEENKKMGELDCIAMETAATNASLEIVKELAVAQVEYKFKNDIIDDIINDKYKNEDDIYQRAQAIGWDLSKPYCVVLLQLNNYRECISNDKIIIALKEIMSRVQLMIGSTAIHYTKSLIIINKSDSFLILYPVEEGKESSIKKFAKELHNNIKKQIHKSSLSIGIGTIAQGLKGIKKSYDEAVDAVSFGEMLYKQDVVIKYDELGIYKLLCKYDNIEHLKEFVHPALNKLNQYDIGKNNDLMNTLELYLNYNGNASKTAENLYVHYKTIVYRINRIKEIMELDFEDKNNRLEIEIGLKIIRLLEERNKD